ncbi:DUF4240 domain-containing protein [Streptosporangium sp. NPDC000563]|uniref:DUF4240 domain-containing protein n=1 Tax=unclassified Streptosporangium TaxID=2632669 RepID=UPI0033200676
MDEDAFWELVDRSDRETDTRKKRLAWLDGELSRRSAEEIADFSMWWDSATSRLCTWDMYAVYCYVFSRQSFNAFEYFVNWLVSLGRVAFEQVAADPDSLVELPEFLRLMKVLRARIAAGKYPVWSVNEEPEFELLAYVTFEPYRKATGLDTSHLGDVVHARGVHAKFPLLGENFDGEEWDFEDEAEIGRRLPRVASYLGIF